MIPGDSDLYHQTKETIKDEISEWLVQQGIVPLGKIRDHDDQLWDLATDIMGIYEDAAGRPHPGVR